MQVRQITGRVERGLQLGRKLGFPTANISLVRETAPPAGVYAVRSRLPDGRTVAGVASVGCNPTAPKPEPVLEVWLFDFDEDLYGQVLTTDLIAFLRPEQRFETLEALRRQVFEDAADARLRLGLGAPMRPSSPDLALCDQGRRRCA